MDRVEVPTTDAVLRGSRRRRWSDLTTRQQAAIVLGALAELVITAVALRDLVRRHPHQVRGKKSLWALTFIVQPFGPIMYLLVGRRSTRNST
jgi:hypothetical protein